MKTTKQIFIAFLVGCSLVPFVGTAQNDAVYGQTATVPVPGRFNVLVGSEAGQSIITIPAVFPVGSQNTFVGRRAGFVNLGLDNAFVGNLAGTSNTGNDNAFFGATAGGSNGNGSGNTFIGAGAGSAGATGGNNVFVGRSAGLLASGSNNVYLGFSAGSGQTAAGGLGSGNVFIGNFVGRNDAQSNLSNTLMIHNSFDPNALIIGDFTNRMLNLNVNTAVGSRVVITSGVANTTNNGTSGLRLTNLTSTTNPAVASNGKVLTVDGNGDIVLTNDIGGGITSSCTTNGTIPLTSSSGASLVCSQIIDNGTTVAINTTGPFTYSSLAGFQLGTTIPPTSGTFRLDVNGVTRSVAYFASSDSKFKKDVKPIENAMAEVQKLNGKTYHWKKEQFKSMDFSDQLQFGLIAQELGEVFPSLVAVSDKGDYSINYIGLIPVLIEALKEQQVQIAELQTQIGQNFKQDNNELLTFTNTKIIAVSPNPSNDVMVVSFNVEKSVASAKLLVHDINGNVLSSLQINERDNNITKSLQKDNFGKGIYIVSLVINGKSIDTKKVVFN